MMNKYLYITMFLLLLTMNVFLLYTNIERQNEINVLNAQKKSFDQRSLVGLGEIDSLKHSEVQFKGAGFFLSIFIPPASCSSCLEFEVPNINNLYDEHSEKVEVYILGQNDKFLNTYGFTHNVMVINPMEPVFDEEFNFMNPVAVLTDSLGVVHDFYVAEVGNVKASDRFYKRMDSFFNAIY